jgi:hypothetical protein
MARASSSMPRFRIGDRVLLMSPLDGTQPGAIGTIVKWFVGSSLYDVRFDGQSIVRVVDERKLALAPRERSRRR